ncbi:MAG: response regulator transcription factor [Anaerolineae bacterium]|nr:response regulator transcription factor [Anaerolineae bacterium]
MTVKITIAHATDLVVEGMKAVLRQHRSFQIMGTYFLLSDLLGALATERPDVILLGARIEPDRDVLAVVEQVQTAAPRARILVLSTLSDGFIIQELFTVGAMGYLYKHDPLSQHLVEAIQTVMRGRPYLSPTANSEYLVAMQSVRVDWQLDTEAREVLHQMAQGLRPQEIALLRNVPIRRVYGVGEKLRRRFGAETNEQVIARAAEEGFLP